MQTLDLTTAMSIVTHVLIHVFEKYRNLLTKHENDYKVDECRIIYLFPAEARLSFLSIIVVDNSFE